MKEYKGYGVTVGTFDGVHRGHREVIDFLISECEKRDLRPMVITFDPHPLMVVAPQRLPGMLETTEERIATLQRAGVEVKVLKFIEELRALTVAQWFARLIGECDAKLVVTGFDNTFGSDGMMMNVKDYAAIGKKLGIEVTGAPRLDGVSSTMIRKALGCGDVREAAKMIGSPYALTGKVTHGRGLGRELGSPTANIEADPQLIIPAPGVYCARMEGRRAVVNIGVSPTVSEGLPLSIEVHILDYEGDLYGKKVKVEFLERIRDEKRFSSLEQLKEQIAQDILTVRELKYDD